jgi:hypothetical protein
MALEVQAQSISVPGSARLADWPAPVRQVQHLEVAESAGLGSVPVNHLRVAPALSPHRVLQPPRQGQPSQGKAGDHPRFHHPHYWSQCHRPVQPAPARLPEANRRGTWKPPYSYGYFGAGNSRHWGLHFGYRDRYTEWRLR